MPPDRPVTISQCALYGKFHICLSPFLCSVGLHNLFTHLSPKLYTQYTILAIAIASEQSVFSDQKLAFQSNTKHCKLTTFILYITTFVHVWPDNMPWMHDCIYKFYLWTNCIYLFTVANWRISRCNVRTNWLRFFGSEIKHVDLFPLNTILCLLAYLSQISNTWRIAAGVGARSTISSAYAKHRHNKYQCDIRLWPSQVSPTNRQCRLKSWHRWQPENNLKVYNSVQHVQLKS